MPKLMTMRGLIIGVCLLAAMATTNNVRAEGSITDKTLVAWVKLANLTQRGGSALTLDNQDGRFDAIVFGEVRPGVWMAGSNYFQRTQQDQGQYAVETAGPDESVMVAIVYEGDAVRLHRGGKPYANYTTDHAMAFGDDAVVVMGLRHLESGDRAGLAGRIEEARLYDRPLTAAQIAALMPGDAADTGPLGWWTFEDGRVTDRTGTFPETLLVGGAHVANGALVLDGKGSYLVAARAGQARRWLSRSASGDRIAAARLQREMLLADRHRPRYHFVAPEGHSMPFDPNGAIFWKGRYHLFYIFQNELGHCWGHASSADLLRWRFHPPGLVPAEGDVDRGIFSGNAFINNKGEATILYHGVDAGNCIATSSDDELIDWRKLASNPIIPSPKPGEPEHGLYQSWDPHGWVENDEYHAIFGGNPATLFKGKALDRWRFIGKFLAHEMEDVEADEDLSCPDFFPLGDKHMLLCISHKRGCRYYLGRWDGEKFYPETHGRMNWPGGTCFAPETLLDDQGRRIMWAWVLDGRPMDQINRAGWSGTMTLPRVLSLGGDGALRIEPVKELEQLRMNHRAKTGLVVPADGAIDIDGVRGECMELSIEFAPGSPGSPGSAKRFGLEVRRSPDGSERTVIEVDPAKKTLAIDVTNASLDRSITYRTFVMHGGENPVVTRQEAPFELKEGEALRLRVFLDRSILEVFANGRQCVTQHIYPTREDSLGVRLFAEGGPARVTRLDAWDMDATNPW